MIENTSVIADEITFQSIFCCSQNENFFSLFATWHLQIFFGMNCVYTSLLKYTYIYLYIFNRLNCLQEINIIKN